MNGEEGISQETLDQLVDTVEAIRLTVQKAEHALRDVIRALAAPEGE